MPLPHGQREHGHGDLGRLVEEAGVGQEEIVRPLRGQRVALRQCFIRLGKVRLAGVVDSSNIGGQTDR